MSGLGDDRTEAAAGREPLIFTVHIDFLADDEDEAMFRAMAYAEGLNALRPEVSSYGARLSGQADWSAAVPVFCNTPGPNPADCCVDRFGHEGRHHGPGVSQVWTDDEIPSAPDSPADL